MEIYHFGKRQRKEHLVQYEPNNKGWADGYWQYNSTKWQMSDKQNNAKNDSKWYFVNTKHCGAEGSGVRTLYTNDDKIEVDMKLKLFPLGPEFPQ